MMKSFTLKSKAGCKKLLALFIVLILVSSFFAQLVQTNGGTIKVEPIMIDARGAELSAELYYPAGTIGDDKLPAVIVNHGGGCIYGTMKNIAEELARRGFVVLNISAYGSGLSAQPDYDDAGQGINGFYQSLRAVEGQQSFLPTATPMGLHDAINFVRSLEMVDKENIGMVGHSMGAYRTSAAAALDCGFLTFNDIMLNILCEDFGQSFTEEEIGQNADELAKARLNDDQLAHYNALRAFEEEKFNTRLRSEIVLGIGYEATTSYPQTVEVAGHEVLRSMQTNLCYMSGGYDAAYNFGTMDNTKADWYSADDLTMGDWYRVDDVNSSSAVVGSIFSDSVTDNGELADAIAQRTSRIFIVTPGETHSKEFFSSKTNAAIVKYFEQTLGFNRGYLASGEAAPLDASDNIWMWRAVCNTIAMFSMVGMLVALCGLLVKSERYQDYVVEIPDDKRPSFTKPQIAVFSILTVVLGFLAIYYSNARGLFIFNPSRMWPLGRSCSLAIVFIICLAIAALVMFVLYFIANKKNGNGSGFAALNMNTGFKGFIRHLEIALILLIAAYASLAVMQYFFGQEYRIWMTVFGEMKADYWYMALRYFIVLFPLYVIIAMGLNYPTRTDIPEWKDTLYTVLINSVGIWLCCLINILVAYSRPYNGLFFSSFICSYHMVTVVPLTAYLNRKLYKLTNSVWAGAALCALLVSWSLVCTLGINDVFYGQTWLGNFLFK